MGVVSVVATGPAEVVVALLDGEDCDFVASGVVWPDVATAEVVTVVVVAPDDV